MRELVTLGPWLRRFLTEHVVTERNLARNTRTSYRDSFSLLLPFISGKVRKPVDRLAVADLTSGRVLQFLAHLEEERGCSARTRNQRLAAIRAFARFVGSRDPAQVEWCGHIRAIASKKSMTEPVGWLTRPEMEAISCSARASFCSISHCRRRVSASRTSRPKPASRVMVGVSARSSRSSHVAPPATPWRSSDTVDNVSMATGARRACARSKAAARSRWPGAMIQVPSFLRVTSTPDRRMASRRRTWASANACRAVGS